MTDPTDAPNVEDALARKKLRVHWDSAPPDGLARDAVVRSLYAEVRRRRPQPPGISQDELLWFRSVTAIPGGWRLVLTYDFDHDFASMIDRTESHAVEAEVDASGGSLRVLSWTVR